METNPHLKTETTLRVRPYRFAAQIRMLSCEGHKGYLMYEWVDYYYIFITANDDDFYATCNSLREGRLISLISSHMHRHMTLAVSWCKICLDTARRVLARRHQQIAFYEWIIHGVAEYLVQCGTLALCFWAFCQNPVSSLSFLQRFLAKTYFAQQKPVRSSGQDAESHLIVPWLNLITNIFAKERFREDADADPRVFTLGLSSMCL